MVMNQAEPVGRQAGTLLDVARHARSSYRRSFEASTHDVVRLPEGAINDLIGGISRALTRRIVQILPFWSLGMTDDFSRRIWRDVASSGVEVERLYVIPPGGDPRGSIDQQIKADQEAGVLSSKLDLGTSRDRRSWILSTDVPLSELWLIDDCAAVRKELSDHGPPVWVVSTRAADVQKAASLWQALMSLAASSADPLSKPDLTEPLLESARMIHAMAPMLCTRDQVDRRSCSWYHGAWQYLRLFDMVSSPSWHSQFYLQSLAAALVDGGTRRVLITGAADYSMLAYVLAAARISTVAAEDDLAVHVLDLCPTPLRACAWYAARFGVDIRLHEEDILDEAPALARRLGVPDGSGFDLIATDAFLTRFEQADIDRVVHNWRALLRPGGTVVTTVRLHPREARRGRDGRSGLSQDLVRFSMRLRQRALSWQSMIGTDLDTLLAAAHEYTLRITSMDIGDLDDVIELVRRHDFEVKPGDGGEIETAIVSGELAPAEYARLVLTAI